ncbi:hypothetical protein [Kitasatospora sp. NPDC059599]|uniref:hypothetical protein n=1 Tax=Kitasatospora sp. NPDC059599 TaxID=3346880 RepID=UPI00368FD1E8
MPARRKPLQTDDPMVIAFVRLLHHVVASTGLSVAELAERVRLPRSTIYRALSGTLPRAGFLGRLLVRIEPLSSWDPREVRHAQHRLEQMWVGIAERQHTAPRGRAPRTVVPAVPEQVAFALRFTAYLETLEQRDVVLGEVWSEAWLRRYASGASLPSRKSLAHLGWVLARYHRINDTEPIAELITLAEAAYRARTEARRWQRVLQGGSP